MYIHRCGVDLAIPTKNTTVAIRRPLPSMRGGCHVRVGYGECSTNRLCELSAVEILCVFVANEVQF